MVRIRKYLIIFFALFIFFPVSSNAATELGASTQSPVVGTNFYVQLDLNYGKELEIKDFHVIITYDKSYFELTDVVWLQSRGDYRDLDGTVYIDKTEGRNWHSGATLQLKFKVLKDGITRVDIKRNGDSHYANGDIIGQSFAPVSINAMKPSSSTMIGSLYVKGYTMLPTFSKTTYSYNLTVPSNVSEVEVVATKSDSRQTITGAGKKKLAYGDNRVRVLVTAQDGSSRTYEIMIHRTDDRTGDISLKNLVVSNTSLKYVENQTTYETTVSRSIDKVLITASPNDANATLTGTGEKDLKIGKNTFTLTVMSSGGKSQSYTIIINRSTEELEVITESSKLQSLRVNNLGLDLSDDKTKWLFGVTKEYKQLSINAVPMSKTAKVEIIGNDNLKEGINVITVRVKETKGILEEAEKQDEDNNQEELEDITEYTLIVNKNVLNASVINDLNNLTGTGNFVFNTTSSNSNVIPESAIKVLKENNSSLYYNVVNIYNGLLYQAVISNNLPDNSLDASFKLVSTGLLTYETSLPENTKITLYLADYFSDDSAVKIYTYNEGGQYTLLTDGITVKNGYVTFTTNGEHNYVFSIRSLIEEQSPLEEFITKYKNIFFGVIGGLVALIFIIYFINKKNKQKEKNEPLY